MGALVIGVYEPLLIAFLLVTGFSWLVIIVKRWSKPQARLHARQNTRGEVSDRRVGVAADVSDFSGHLEGREARIEGAVDGVVLHCPALGRREYYRLPSGAELPFPQMLNQLIG